MNHSFDLLDLSWVDELAENDFVIIDNLLNSKDLSIIQSHFDNLIEADALQKAGISSQKVIQKDVRGDFVHWIRSEEEINQLNVFFQKANMIHEILNRYCFLSISDKEFHFALYPEGTFYERHLDQFNERNNRMISAVLYLNEEWKDGDGGELRIFKNNQEIDIAPVSNRLALFKSDCIEHEVLITSKPRRSLTGWFLYQPAGIGFLG